TDSFQLLNGLTLQGNLTHIGQNFLSPQASGAFLPMNQVLGSINWRAASWLAASFTAKALERLDSTKATDRSYSVAVSVTPRGYLPTIVFMHTVDVGSQLQYLAYPGNPVARVGYDPNQPPLLLPGSTQVQSGEYTLLNAMKEFTGWRLFANLSRI